MIMNVNHPHHAAHVRFGIITVAVLLTVAFHFLIAERWFGLGLAIAAIFLVVGIHVIDVLAAKPNNTWAYVFLAPLFTAAAAECMYASPVVRALALPIMTVSAALFAYWFTASRVGFWDAPVLWPASAVAETVWPFRGVSGMTAGLTKTEKIRKILLGLVIAAPVVVIIIALFSGADAVFGKAVSGIFDFQNAAINIYRIVRDVFVALFLVASGWTVYTRVSDGRKARVGASANAGDKTIIATFLAVLNLLFLVFIAFQAAAFFGGQKFVEAQGITYADYARNGFFQLLAVSGIVFLIMIAIYRWTHLREWASRILGIALIVETGIIIASAVRRLALYIDAYGLTLSRYWAMTVIIIIAAVLTTLLIGALAKIKYEMIIRSVFIGLLVIFPFLLLVNVEGYIVKFNFDRYINGQTDLFDVPYLSALDADAVPALAATLEINWPASSKIGPLSESRLFGALNQKSESLQKLIGGDWRDVVVSDYRALAVLSDFKSVKQSTLVPSKYTGNIGLSDISPLYGAVVLPEEIDGNLSIDDYYLTKATILPNLITGNMIVTGNGNIGSLSLPIGRIGGNLALSDVTIQSFAAMPKSIGGDLDLREALVLGMLPSGIDLHGKLLVSKNTGYTDLAKLQLFIKDAQSKGYKVDVPLELMSNLPLIGIPPGPCGSDEFPCSLVPAR
jgi:hypothetical protein